jgi:catechol 2,3-dioxygenase-like lactoylglutathione lyase family enzyme
MILTHVTIVVKDQNAALEFYTKKMGFEKKADYQNPGQSRWLTVAPKGQAIEMVLYQAGSMLNPKLPTSHELPGIGTRWVLEVDDVRKTFAELKAKGVKFLDPQPIEEGWGFSADLVDPDGNHFTIHETRTPSATADRAKTGEKA